MREGTGTQPGGVGNNFGRTCRDEGGCPRVAVPPWLKNGIPVALGNTSHQNLFDVILNNSQRGEIFHDINVFSGSQI